MLSDVTRQPAAAAEGLAAAPVVGEELLERGFCRAVMENAVRSAAWGSCGPTRGRFLVNLDPDKLKMGC